MRRVLASRQSKTHPPQNCVEHLVHLRGFRLCPQPLHKCTAFTGQPRLRMHRWKSNGAHACANKPKHLISSGLSQSVCECLSVCLSEASEGCIMTMSRCELKKRHTRPLLAVCTQCAPASVGQTKPPKMRETTKNPKTKAEPSYESDKWAARDP